MTAAPASHARCSSSTPLAGAVAIDTDMRILDVFGYTIALSSPRRPHEGRLTAATPRGRLRAAHSVAEHGTSPVLGAQESVGVSWRRHP